MKIPDFGKFINNDWNKFLPKIMSEAREKAAEAMGQSNVSKMPIIFGSHTGDQKYLSQFHPGMPHRASFDAEGNPRVDPMGSTKGSIMAKALEDRYGPAMVKMGKYFDTHGALPGKAGDTAPEVAFVLPGAKEGEGKPYYIVYTAIDGQPIYVGHNDLAEKLTKPAKPTESADLGGKSKLFRAGKGLRELDPAHPEHAAHKNEYEQHHGYYNFDLSNVQDPEDVDKVTDVEIMRLLSSGDKGKIAKIPGESDDDKVNNPEVQEMIAAKREKMKKSLKEKITGYEPLKPTKASEVVRDWMNAGSMGLLDPALKDKKTVKDPLTGEDVDLYWLNPSEAEKLVGRTISTGFDVGTVRKIGGITKQIQPGNHEKLKLPVIKRTVSYKITDINGKELDTKTNVPIFVPFLPDMKVVPKLPAGIPGISLTQEQKALLAHRNGAKEITGKTDEERKAQFRDAMEKKGNAKLRDLAAFQDIADVIKHWDILNPEQQQYMRDHMEDLLNVSKAMNVRDAEFKQEHEKDHKHAYDYYGLGYDVNKGKGRQDILGIDDPNMIHKLIDKYRTDMAGEAAIAVTNWIRDSGGDPNVDEDKEAAMKYISGKYGAVKISRPIGKKSPDAVAALAGVSENIIVIMTYWLLTFLNSRDMGIYDPSVGLNEEKSEDALEDSGGGAARKRMGAVYDQMNKLVQASISGFPSRRARETYAQIKRGNYEYAGEAGDSVSAADMYSSDQQQSGKEKAVDWMQKWGFKRHHLPAGVGLNPDKEVQIALQKATIPNFMINVTERISHQLGGQVDNVIEDQQAKMALGISQSQQLAQQIDKELQSSIPDEDSREKAVAVELRKRLPEYLSNLFPTMFSKNMEEKELSVLAKKPEEEFISTDYRNSNPDFDKKLEQAMNKFFENLFEGEDDEAVLPIYNSKNKAFEFEGDIMSLYGPPFRHPKNNIHRPTTAEEIVKAFKEIYEIAARNAPGIDSVIQRGLNRHALDIYEGVLAEEGVKKSKDQMKKELMQYGVQPEGWEKLVPETPVQAPQAQQPTAQAALPAVAARPINDLIQGLSSDWFTKPTVPEKLQAFAKAYNDILQYKDELLKLPKDERKALAQKLHIADANGYFGEFEKMRHNGQLPPEAAKVPMIVTARNAFANLLLALRSS